MFRFIQANYQTFYLNVKKSSAALSGSVTSEDFDLWHGTHRHSPALEFKLKKLTYIHSLNKTKQPFYNILQCFRVKVDLRKNSKKDFENLTLENTK